MKFLCGGCGKVLDSALDLSYTLIHNVTGNRDVLCETCVRQIIGQKERQVNTLLREIKEKQIRKGENKKL
jgi:hypothetical protein